MVKKAKKQRVFTKQEELLQYNKEHYEIKKRQLGKVFVGDFGYLCNKCGKELSAAIPRFYKRLYKDNFVEHLLCYDCQGKGGEKK